MKTPAISFSLYDKYVKVKVLVFVAVAKLRMVLSLVKHPHIKDLVRVGVATVIVEWTIPE